MQSLQQSETPPQSKAVEATTTQDSEAVSPTHTILVKLDRELGTGNKGKPVNFSIQLALFLARAMKLFPHTTLLPFYPKDMDLATITTSADIPKNETPLLQYVSDAKVTNSGRLTISFRITSSHTL